MGRLTTLSLRSTTAAVLTAGGVALALLAAGCGERTEPVGRTVPDPYPLTVQAADERPVTIARRPRTVLPVSASAAAIVQALGLRGLVPGAATGGAALRARPLRALATTPVDLVLGSQANDANALARAARQAQVPVVVVADGSIADLQHSILQVGLALGVPVRARGLVQRIDRQLLAVRAAVKGRPPVSFFLDTGFYIPLADDSFAGEVLRAAGGRNIAGRAEGIPYRIDDLLAADPEVYLASAGSGTTLEALRKAPRVERLTAVRSGRFAVVPAELLAPTPGVGDAVARLYALLHEAPADTANAPATTPDTETAP